LTRLDELTVGLHGFHAGHPALPNVSSPAVMVIVLDEAVKGLRAYGFDPGVNQLTRKQFCECLIVTSVQCRWIG
jgi:hypothetical protein